MKLFMCVNYPIYNPALGLSKKIQSQIECFEKLGYEVTYSAYTENSVVICRGKKTLEEKRYPSFVPHQFYGIIRKNYWLKTCREYLEKYNERYDVGFLRWGAVDQSMLKTLSIMDDRCDRIIMDFHGYHKNYKGHTVKGKYIETTTRKNGGKLSQFIDACLTESRNDQLFSIPAVPMDTGIDVGKYHPHQYAGATDELHMISVANERSYHGYDRVIKGLANAKNEKVFLHLVGDMSKKTVKLVSRLNLKNKVIFHGYQTGTSLEAIYNRCNIGVGPLAPHRNGGKEGTGIKTKEFFAIGLPYFYAGQELLVPDSYPYVLKLPANDSPIDINTVLSFYKDIQNTQTMQEDMRQFARDHFSWERIFIKALHIAGVHE